MAPSEFSRIIFSAALFAALSFKAGEASPSENVSILDEYHNFSEQLGDEFHGAIRADRAPNYQAIIDLFHLRFGHDYSAARLASLEPMELQALFRAVHDFNFYVPSSESAKTLHGIWGELNSRVSEKPVGDLEYDVQPASAQEVYDALITARIFDLAQQFSKDHPTVNAINWELTDGAMPEKAYGSPAVLIFRADGNATRAVIEHKDPTAGSRIVVVVHPFCGPSRRMMEYVESDDELKAAFSGRTDWVAWPRASLLADPILAWNQDAEEIEISVVYREDDWPENIRFFQTPLFYFLREGDVVHRFSGWPDDDQAKQLQVGFERLNEN